MATVIYTLLKISSEGYDDYQHVRIAQNNRIRDLIRRKAEGIPLDYPEDKKENKTFDLKYKTENLPNILDELVKDKKLSKMELKYIKELQGIAEIAEKTENYYKSLMLKVLKQEELWKDWLLKVKGIGPILGAGLIKNFGYCETYVHISSLWRHCGYDPEGALPKQVGKKTHYNPKLKTFVWKISESLLKQRSQPYREVYDNEKERQVKLMEKCQCICCGKGPKEHSRNKKKYRDMEYHCKDGEIYSPDVPLAPMSLKHADNRAKRKAVKIFLQHYWLVARKMKGLEVSKPYPFDKLGEKHKHYISPPHLD